MDLDLIQHAISRNISSTTSKCLLAQPKRSKLHQNIGIHIQTGYSRLLKHLCKIGVTAALIFEECGEEVEETIYKAIYNITWTNLSFYHFSLESVLFFLPFEFYESSIFQAVPILFPP